MTTNMGYGFILDPPKRASLYATVNIGILLVEWAAVLLLGGVVFIFLKESDSSIKNKSNDTRTSPSQGNTKTSVVGQTETARSEIASNNINSIEKDPWLRAELVSSDGNTKNFDYLEARPWDRLWARSIDYALFLIAFNILFIVLSIEGIPLAFSQNLFIEILIWFVISDTLLVFYEAIWLCSVTTTPGKALFGINVLTKDGGRLSFRQAIRRTFSVLASGFAFLIFFPIIPAFTMWGSYKEIKNTGQASWDKKEGYQVVHKPINTIRLGFGISLGLVAIIAIGVVQIVMKQINKEIVKEQVYQEYGFGRK